MTPVEGHGQGMARGMAGGMARTVARTRFGPGPQGPERGSAAITF